MNLKHIVEGLKSCARKQTKGKTHEAEISTEIHSNFSYKPLALKTRFLGGKWKCFKANISEWDTHFTGKSN